tara:strand:- start:367 stop:1584 length:1218 start_codon:yes stop_codon:yes gene_type:complete
MLIKNKIPKSEPVVSIGLVLPEDRKESIKIIDLQKNQSLKIDYNFDGKKLPYSKYHLSSICVGRGFHWEKQIEINIEGELKIRFIDGALLITNQITLEKYLASVATSEMSGDCPPALLEAQTIAARSWLLAANEQKHIKLGLDACNDDCCQRYQGTDFITTSAQKAVNNTIGQVLVFNGHICDARYSKSCGGISENNENVWQMEPKPYLRSIFDGENLRIPKFDSSSNLKKWMNTEQNCYCSPKFVQKNNLNKYLGHVDKTKSYFRWRVQFTQQDLIKLIYNKTGQHYDYIQSLEPIKRGISGRIIQLEIHGINKGIQLIKTINSEYEIRRILHPDFLFSSAFIIEANSKNNSIPVSFTFIGAGWGHGVGLCQIGALGMALANKSAYEILFHYYSDTEIKTLYTI